MASFALVILFVGVLINAVNYYVTQREVHWSLEQLAEMQASVEDPFDETQPFPDAPSITEAFSPGYRNNTFYILSYDSDGTENSLYTSRGNPYAESVIRKNAADILKEGKAEGRSGVFYYQKTVNDDGSSLLVIMDSSYVIFTRIRLMYASLAVGIISILAALVLVIRLSEKMILPEIESSKRQNQFLTNISHELKTPLAVIRSNAEMEEVMNGENEWTQSTIRQVDRMSGLIKNLVMITKAKEIEGLSLSNSVNVSDVISQTVKEYSAMADSRNIALHERIEANIEMLLDESKLRQLAVILFDNAVKYCDQDGEITVFMERLKKGNNKLRIIVSNSYADGQTIDCSRFFDRFYREDTSRNIDTGGYGIGLSIAENICEQFGGSINVLWEDGIISFLCDIC